ncbi:MAG: putative bifunctional diguanylate cyclase/phosphodiesterase [Nitriliruptoraceae bacterium]
MAGNDAVAADGQLFALLEELPTLLQSFAAFDNVALDEGLEQVVARLGQIAGVDRAYTFEVARRPTGAVLVNTHEWCAEGITPQREQLQAVPYETLDPWLASLEARDTVYIRRVEDLPSSRPDREVLQAQDIRSLVVTPLVAQDELIGFMGFDAVRAERRWSRGELVLLEVVADAVCGALQRRRAHERLTASERRYRLLASHSSDLVVTIGADGAFLDISPSAASLLGWPLEEARRSAPIDHVHPHDWHLALLELEQARASAGTAVELPDLRLRHQDGTWRWIQATAIDLSDEPAFGGVVVIGHDITDRKAAEAALSYQAVHDPLTGLANRPLLLDRLQHALDRCDRNDHTVALLFLDLDRFKVVNDSLGHAAGDELLRAYAARLHSLVRAGDTVGRFGGDEFVVVLEDVTDEQQAVEVAERLLADLEEPVDLRGRAHRVTASAGLVIAGPGDRAEVLLRDADAAMYQAKARGRQRVVTLDDEVRRSLVEEAELTRELQGMEERDELTIHYQPVLELATGRYVAFEALARWEHPVRGRIEPGRFIPLAEEHATIVPIGRAVLHQAVTQLRAWDADDPTNRTRRMAVNLSVQQLLDPLLVDDLNEVLERTGLEPSRLELELTESALMREPDASRRALRRVRDLGVEVAIDDFGTGYSSLAYLRALPVSALKIDRSFIADLAHDPRASRVVAVVLNLAAEFGLRVVAEGVETPAQQLELERLGCRLAQGYGLARPAPPQVWERQTFMPMARSSSRT